VDETVPENVAGQDENKDKDPNDVDENSNKKIEEDKIETLDKD
jgi:hypothetical protein